jgi:F0F1-type ATP synthase assembly protein I
MKRVGQIAGLATELGVTMGLTSAGLVFLGLWAGRQLDALLGTKPYATIVLLVLGVIAGQVAIIRLAVRSRQYLLQQEEHAFTLRDATTGLLTAAKALALVALPALLRLLGLWLDHALDTGVLFSLALVVIGLVVGVAGLLHLAESVRSPASKR